MNIAIIGYGKMGKAIEQLATAEGHTISGRMASDNRGDWSVLHGADVAIEFTNPQSAPENLIACLERNIPVVTGSTGWYDQFDEIKTRFEKENGALLYATNFSIGVNLTMELNRKLAELMNDYPEYHPEISETHHTEKLDSPSGTAITLAEDMVDILSRKNRWVNSESNNAQTLPVISHRKPDVPGTHEIIYTSDCDEIKLVHTAKSREGFAKGALLSAEWLAGKKGVYNIKDVLNLNQRT